jgi:chromosome segregation ATPase
MPSYPPQPHPDPLKAFAAAMSGDYAAKYPQILNEAFSSHGLILNATQLRELAGGGSQATAQRAITAWRQDLSIKLAAKVRLGAQVPEEVLHAANGLLEALWMQARDHAAKEFAQERAAFQEDRAATAQHLEEMLRKLQHAENEIATARGLAESKEAQLSQTRSALISAQAQIDQAAHDLQRERQAHARFSDEARRTQETLEAKVAEAHILRERLQEEMAKAQREAAQRHDRMLVEHREAVASVQRACDERLAEKSSHLQQLQAKLDAAISENLEMQMRAVRTAGQVDHLTQQAAAYRAEIEALTAAVQSAREQFQAAQAQLIEHLRATQVPAPAKT